MYEGLRPWKNFCFSFPSSSSLKKKKKKQRNLLFPQIQRLNTSDEEAKVYLCPMKKHGRSYQPPRTPTLPPLTYINMPTSGAAPGRGEGLKPGLGM